MTHIDDAAIASLRNYYDAVLPRSGRVLDFCSSWVSHYPERVESAVKAGELRVVGLGMNRAELEANDVLNGGRGVVDLNLKPDVGAALREMEAKDGVDGGGLLDAATNVVSTDYLTQPVEVLRSLRDVMQEGGRVHLVISNRCFPTKAIDRWLKVSEEERLNMVGDFLHFAGWKEIEIVELSSGKVDGDEGNGGAGGAQRSLQNFMSWMGMASRDPLWVVRAVKRGD